MASQESPSISGVVIGTVITALLIACAFSTIPTPEYQKFEDLEGEGGGESSLSQEWFIHPTFPLTTQTIEENRAAFAPITYENQDLEVKGNKLRDDLIAKFRVANNAHFALSPNAPTDIQNIEQQLAILSGEWFETVKDFNSFVHVGDPLFKECDDALSMILTKVADGQWKIENDNLPKDILRSDELKSYRETCGDALPLLVNFNLIHPGTGTWQSPQAKNIFDALQRLRFQQLVETRVPSSKGLSPADQLLVAWWKTMTPGAFPTNQRRQFLQLLRGSLSSTPLADPHSPYYFDSTRAEAYITYNDMVGAEPSAVSDAIKKIFLDRCSQADATSQEKDACNYLKKHALR